MEAHSLDRILVVTPYLAQCERLLQRGINAKTFATCQGLDADTVIVDLFRWSPKFQAFSSRAMRVAFTRAKSKLIMTCNLFCKYRRMFVVPDDKVLSFFSTRDWLDDVYPKVLPQSTDLATVVIS